MPISDLQLATLRAQLAGDAAEHRRLLSQLDPGTDQRPYAILANAAFIETAGRRFGNRGTPAAARAFVADVRTRSETVRDSLDPPLAEQVLLTAIADGTISGIDPWAVRSTQLVMLAAMIADEQPDDAQLDEFLAAVRALAESMLA